MKIIRSVVEFLCWVFLLITTPPDHPEQPDPEMNKKCRSFLEISWIKWFWSVKSLLALIVIMLVGFVAMPRLLHAVDSTAAPLDLGVLSFVGLAVVAVLVVLLVFWAIIKSEFPVVDKWVDGDLEKDETLPTELRVSLNKDWLHSRPEFRIGAFFFLMAVMILAGAMLVMAAF